MNCWREVCALILKMLTHLRVDPLDKYIMNGNDIQSHEVDYNLFQLWKTYRGKKNVTGTVNTNILQYSLINDEWTSCLMKW